MLSKVLEEEFPEVKRSARYTATSLIFVPENRTDAFDESGTYADSTLFAMIGMNFISGDPLSVFEPEHPIVISQAMAKKLFGAEDPVGSILTNEGQQYEITGIFSDLPDNTTFQFQWVIPFRIQEEKVANLISTDNWNTIWMQTYTELQPHADVEQLNGKLQTLAYEKGGAQLENTHIFLYPLNRTLLYGEFKESRETGGGFIKTVRLFFLIGVLILVIACINFMNLSTARSQKRALEVGVRKTFGTRRKYLIRQFFVESGLITAIALLLSVGLIWICLPHFNRLIHTSLSFNLTDLNILCGLLVIGLFCTLLAGSYPALYLSSFNPVMTLKMQKITKGGKAVWIRQSLVVFQFTMAFILVCTTFVIYLQIQLAQNRDLGIQKEDLLTFPVTKELLASYSAVQNELKNTGVVESSGFTSQTLFSMGTQASTWYWHGKDPADDTAINYSFASEGLIGAAGIQLIEGTDFNPAQNPRGVLINETQARRMGKEGRIGAKIGQTQDSDRQLEVVGIIRNYVFNNLYTLDVPPVLFFHSPENTAHLFVRLKPDTDVFEGITRVQSVLREFTPYHAFNPTFMTDRFNRMFQQDKLVEKLSALFAALAIFISCLGLLGLSSFSAEQRTKEIGVRKVMGAKVTDILLMLGKTYIKLLILSFAIGVPISLYITHLYLKEYAYRIILSWDIFAAVALFVALIAISAVSFQSMKAAIANPIKSIKTE